jgi:hypothetical protein
LATSGNEIANCSLLLRRGITLGLTLDAHFPEQRANLRAEDWARFLEESGVVPAGTL